MHQPNVSSPGPSAPSTPSAPSSDSAASRPAAAPLAAQSALPRPWTRLLPRPGAPRADLLVCCLSLAACVILWRMPTGFEDRQQTQAQQVRAKVAEVRNDAFRQYGLLNVGEQGLAVEVLEGPFAGRTFPAQNLLMGKLDMDKVFAPGDEVLAVLSLRGDEVVHVTAQDHYRLDRLAWLAAPFALGLLLFAGWTGVKSLLGFAVSALVIWKALVPLFLRGHDPLSVSVGLLAVLMAVVVFLVAGPTRKGLAAYLGSLGGVGVTALLSVLGSGGLRLPGAVLPFSETLLYSGFAHLDLSRIFLASIFFGASGAIMDVAMDVAASMEEMHQKHPDMGCAERLASGFRVGRVVVGTMTTTLLLAYSGSSLAMLMVFMGQGIPLTNAANFNLVAAEIANTLIGSFGLVLAAPLTALAHAALARRGAASRRPAP